MNDVLWEFNHSVECGAPREFAWKYWTNPENWDDPPARFEFDGPFAAGTKLKTLLPGLTLESLIESVEPGYGATILLAYAKATISFRWRFAEVASEMARISQRIELSGTNDASVVEQAVVLERTVPAGMQKIKQRIEAAWQRRER